MTAAQMKGYLFEVVVRRLLALNGWRLVSEPEDERVMIHNNYRIEIRGRGINHQIDSPCLSDRPIPFVYPLRLIVEAKFYNQVVKKDHVRPFVGLMKDISENYVVSPQPRAKQAKRYTDVGAFFSASGFHREAIHLAHAHGIVTVSYRTNPLLVEVTDAITRLVEWSFPSWPKVEDAGGLFVFMNDMDHYLAGTLGVDDVMSKYGTNDDHGAVNDFRTSMDTLVTTFIGTTSSGVLLHFLSRSLFPDELFEEGDAQKCQVFFDQQDVSSGEFSMWLEFVEDREYPRRRFYFDVPPGLEDAIRRGEGVLSAKREILPSIVVPLRINNLARTLILTLDLDWLDRLEEENRRMG